MLTAIILFGVLSWIPWEAVKGIICIAMVAFTILYLWKHSRKDLFILLLLYAIFLPLLFFGAKGAMILGMITSYFIGIMVNIVIIGSSLASFASKKGRKLRAISKWALLIILWRKKECHILSNLGMAFLFLVD